jgi:acyl carrier protein
MLALPEQPATTSVEALVERDVAADVVAIFRKVVSLPAAEPVDPTVELGNHEGWDSICHVEMVVLIEQQYGIRLSEADLTYFTTLESVIQVLQKKLSEH